MEASNQWWWEGFPVDSVSNDRIHCYEKLIEDSYSHRSTYAMRRLFNDAAQPEEAKFLLLGIFHRERESLETDIISSTPIGIFGSFYKMVGSEQRDAAINAILSSPTTRFDYVAKPYLGNHMANAEWSDCTAAEYTFYQRIRKRVILGNLCMLEQVPSVEDAFYRTLQAKELFDVAQLDRERIRTIYRLKELQEALNQQAAIAFQPTPIYNLVSLACGVLSAVNSPTSVLFQLIIECLYCEHRLAEKKVDFFLESIDHLLARLLLEVYGGQYHRSVAVPTLGESIEITTEPGMRLSMIAIIAGSVRLRNQPLPPLLAETVRIISQQNQQLIRMISSSVGTRYQIYSFEWWNNPGIRRESRLDALKFVLSKAPIDQVRHIIANFFQNRESRRRLLQNLLMNVASLYRFVDQPIEIVTIRYRQLAYPTLLMPRAEENVTTLQQQ